MAVLSHKRVFVSTDGGTTFHPLSELKTPNETTPEADYVEWCSAIAVHPDDQRIILAGHAYLWCTRDQDASGWERHAQHPLVDGRVHTDQQAIVFDPSDHSHIFVATAGGVWESRDTGAHWTPCSRGLTTTQC